MDIIFDIDGTLMDISHRRHFVEGTDKKDWKSFNAAMAYDKPNKIICTIAKVLGNASDEERYPDVDHRILITTGRFESDRQLTEQQLRAAHVPYHELLMRPYNDYRDDAMLKLSMLTDLREAGYNPVLAFDDRQRVVNMWRAAGIICCQVAPGDF